jgi:hypothetical protein
MFGDDWNVHSEARARVMVQNDWMQDLERRLTVIFEANAGMYHGTRFVDRFPYLEWSHQRLIDAIRELFNSRPRMSRRGAELAD